MRLAEGALLLAMAAGCVSPTKSQGPYQPPEEAARDTTLAEQLTRDAAELVEEAPLRAEELLREALAADIFHGPAHNNLGVVFLNQGKLYEAAQEFEWARKLLPGHPDPRVNLALTLEGAGRTDEALAAYEAALEVYPDYLPAIMGAAGLVARTSGTDERMDKWLQEISVRSKDLPWRNWSREQQIHTNSHK